MALTRERDYLGGTQALGDGTNRNRRVTLTEGGGVFEPPFFVRYGPSGAVRMVEALPYVEQVRAGSIELEAELALARKRLASQWRFAGPVRKVLGSRWGVQLPARRVLGSRWGVVQTPGGGSLDWPNEPAGMTTITETDWHEAGSWNLIGTDEEWTGNGWVRKIDPNQADAMEIITIGDHPIAGMTKVLRARAPTGTDGGFGPFAYHERGVSSIGDWQGGCRELYYGYWHRIVSGFEGHSSSSNKSFDVRVNNGPSTQSHWNIPWAPGFFAQASLRYDATAGGTLGCSQTFGNVGSDVYQTGVWAKYEGQIILPATDGATGTWRIWKNGNLILNLTGVCDLGTNALLYVCLLSATWGGLTGKLTHHNDQHFGPVRLSGRVFAS